MSDGSASTFPDADYEPFWMDQSPLARQVSEHVHNAINDAISRHDHLIASYDNWMARPTELGRLRDALTVGPINLAKCLPNTASSEVVPDLVELEVAVPRLTPTLG